MNIARHCIPILIVLVLSVGHAASSMATDYYVDNQSTGSGSGTTMADAWKSFSAIAWSRISPGDTIYISGGPTSRTYRERLIVGASGTASARITIARSTEQGHSGEVIIDGEYSRGSGVYIDNKDYVTIRGLSLRHAVDSGGKGEIYLRSTLGTIIEQCSIEVEKTHGGVHLNGYPGGSSANRDCVIRNNSITTPAKYCTGQTDGIYSQYSIDNIYEKNTIIIRNTNEVQHCDAVQCFRDTETTLRSNYVEQDNQKGANAQGLFVSNSSGMTRIYNNICKGMYTTSSLLKFRNTDGSPGTVGFYNNIVLGGQSNLLYSDDPYSQIINNIIMSTGGYYVIWFGSGVTIRDFTNIDNNILYNQGRTTVVRYRDSNLTMPQWQGLGADTNGVFSDPKLDINDRLYPGAESLVAGAGRNLSSLGFITSDVTGTLRPASGPWSIGAYEFSGGSMEPPKVEGLEVIEQ